MKNPRPQAFLLLLVLFAQNIFAQHQSRALEFVTQQDNFQINLENQAADAPFITVAVSTSKTNDVPIFMQTDLRPATWLRPFHEANASDKNIFELTFLASTTKTITLTTPRQPTQPINIRIYLPTKTGLYATADAVIRDDCDCPQPALCQRDCWCPNGDCPPDPTPVATTPTHLVVHHSAANTVSDDFAAVVRAYWDFHVNFNGWDDIGYNWLIDGNGVVYAGRGAGRQGAHFSCMNSFTTGICMIGNFEESVPTDTAVAQLVNLLAWECCQYGILPEAGSVHDVSGSMVPNIAGHLDGNGLPNSCGTTACPGENLYPLLPNIREMVGMKTCLANLTNITEVTNPTPVFLTPNPSTGHFNIDGSIEAIEHISVFTIVGKQIESNWKDGNSLTISRKGIFFVKIQLKNNHVEIKKVLIH